MKRFAILILALLTGLSTWFLMQREQNSRTRVGVEQQDQTPTVDVLVYGRDLERGTYLTRDVFAWEERLQSTAPSRAIVRRDNKEPIPKELSGKLLRNGVNKGEAVQLTSLLEGSASFLALAVSPGMRAVAVRVTPVKIAGGYILPDDRVDIVHTVVRDVTGSGIKSGISAVILRNVRVLAIGETPTRRNVGRSVAQQEASVDKKSPTTLVGETATLEVSEDQAMVLSSAASVGQLTFALRPIEDQGEATIGNLSTLLETPKLLPPQKIAQPIESAKQPKTTRKITVISGEVLTIIEVPISQ